MIMSKLDVLMGQEARRWLRARCDWADFGESDRAEQLVCRALKRKAMTAYATRSCSTVAQPRPTL